MPIAANTELSASILKLLESAQNVDAGLLPDSIERDELDAHHYVRWAEAQSLHIAENQQLVEYRVQSLSVSHRARRRAIEDQLARATNEKIRIMKQSELARADMDFERRMEELKRAAATGDIRVLPVVFGAITVTGPLA